MSTVRKVPVVGSYAVLQTIARHPRSRPPPDGEAPPAPPRKEPPKKRRPGTSLTHTVMPTRHALFCYHCGEAFHLLGQHRFTLCPRCRQRVDIVHYALEGVFDQEISTAGDVCLKPGSSLCGGHIKATVIRVEGRVESGRLEALRLELQGKGRLAPEAETRFQDLVVGPGVAARFEAPLCCRNLTVSGRLRARIQVEGLTLVRAGGCVRGTLTANRLQVEEGGGLHAVLDIQPLRETKSE